MSWFLAILLCLCLAAASALLVLQALDLLAGLRASYADAVENGRDEGGELDHVRGDVA
jgi:hypothetical protein